MMTLRMKELPHFASGIIVKGFGRGSKELGIPTANFSKEVVDKLSENIKTGVYFGWANVDNGTVYKMVMSIGWNPFYINKEKSMETHILHAYNQDLYGHLLKVCICGWIREEKNFNSLDTLIKEINNDIDKAKQLLDEPEFKKYKTNDFFNVP